MTKAVETSIQAVSPVSTLGGAAVAAGAAGVWEKAARQQASMSAARVGQRTALRKALRIGARDSSRASRGFIVGFSSVIIGRGVPPLPAAVGGRAGWSLTPS